MCVGEGGQNSRTLVRRVVGTGGREYLDICIGTICICMYRCVYVCIAVYMCVYV